MAIALLQLELSEKLKPVIINNDYDECRILVRFYRQPLGWVAFKEITGGFISTEELEVGIKKQVGWPLVEQSFIHYIKEDENNFSSFEPISVIICTRNRTEQLAECLKSLLALEYAAYEIIIVDNAPDNEDTYKLVKELPVRYVREERPGLDWARNRGISEASHSIVAFTDDDVHVDRYWLQAIAQGFFNPDVMAVTGYVAPAELETPAQRLFELGYGGMGHGFKRKRIQRDVLIDRQLLWASGFGVGANMAFRASVFDKIGMFDVALDVGTPSRGGGDIEMFHRLVAHGHLLIYEPGVLVYHTHRQSIAALRRQIADNGCSFGCYLINCFRQRTVTPSSVISFFLLEWLYRWNMKNLLRPSGKIPRYFSVIELMGMLRSPFAYRATKAHARKIRERYKTDN
ncbi:MAG TPA: glycosyltransferase [Chitinophagaceae bacterium]|nr:glycosyltransferase [Chitinophagaceae bacterium]